MPEGGQVDRRPNAETVTCRFKAVIGRSLRAGTLPARKTKIAVDYTALNRTTSLGRLVSHQLACNAGLFNAMQLRAF